MVIFYLRSSFGKSGGVATTLMTLPASFRLTASSIFGGKLLAQSGQ